MHQEDALSPKPPSKLPIGEALRVRRVEGLKKGLRETARLLSVAPAHLTDIEKGRRNPSEDLLMRICRVYGIAEAELRAGWSRPETIVDEVASQDALTAAKVPEFLRTARNLSPEQWNNLIRQAERMAHKKGKG
jgi:transcriptional regulator with XRE-family HTH domain